MAEEKIAELQALLTALQAQHEALQQQHPPVQRDQQSEAVCRVAVRLPPFWAEKPDLWFSQAEAQFNISGVTQDSTRFNYIISQLEPRYAAEVHDIISNPPQEGRYSTLKTELIRRLSQSKEQRVRQLLMHEEMGDRKPSQFLRHLRSLAGTEDVPDSLLRTVWAGHLPQHIQVVIATQQGATLDSIAATADKVYEVAPMSRVAAVTPSLPPQICAITQRLEELSRQVAALSTHLPSPRSRSKSRGRSQMKIGNPNEDAGERSMCWYHRKFGIDAKRCTKPCTFSLNSQSSQL